MGKAACEKVGVQRAGCRQDLWCQLVHQAPWKGVKAQDEDWEGKEGGFAGGTGGGLSAARES